LTTVSNDVEANGFEGRVARVSDLVSGDPAAAEAALMLGIAIALADDNVSDEERDIAYQIAKATGLSIALDALITEIRG
jgi:tellurite resistance protein